MTVLLGVFQLLVEQLPDPTHKTRIKCFFFFKKNFFSLCKPLRGFPVQFFFKDYLLKNVYSLHGTSQDSSLLCFGTGVFSGLQCSQYCQQINENEICIFQEDILLVCTLFITFRKQDSVLIAYKKCKFCKTDFIIFYLIILVLSTSRVAGL